jgi:hypothetical protein
VKIFGVQIGGIAADATQSAEVTTLARDLRDAETKLAEAQRLHRISVGLAETASGAVKHAIDTLNAQPFVSKETQDMRFNMHVEKSRFTERQVELSKAEKVLADATMAVDSLRRQIKQHPEYSAAVSEQWKIISEGVECAAKAWRTPLIEIYRTVREFEGISGRENDLVEELNTTLTALGLPEIKPKLRNYWHALPLMIREEDISELAREASEALAGCLRTEAI